MPSVKQIIFASGLVFALLATAAAQESTSTTAQITSLTITATAAGERVRITAPSSVVQMHVEVYAASGEKLFDQEIRGGNVFDWHLQDGQAQRLAPGTYVCVVTAKSVSGKLTQKIGTVSVEEKSVSVQPAESPQLSAPQAQAIGPVEENSSWTIPTKDEPQTGTVIANDGTDGQMIRGRGALTFRIGNFFSGIDQEQMRLTEEGSLGIGTSAPQAKLDVAGTIRAERFLVAKPKLAGLDKTGTLAADAVDLVQPLIAGTGTLNHIAKWTPDGSTLGDSGIFETAGGLVGIGTTSPNAKLTVNANSGIPPIAPLGVIAHFVNANENNTFLTADSYGNANLHSDFLFRRARGTMAAPTAVQANDIIGQIQARGYGASGFAATARSSIRLAAAENWTDSAQGAYVSFFTTPNLSTTIAERLRISDAGNVGIGTTAPVSLLHVRGASPVRILGDTTTLAGNEYVDFFARSSIFSSDLGGMRIQRQSNGDIDTIFLAAQGGSSATEIMRVKGNGQVGIGTTLFGDKFAVNGGIQATSLIGNASGGATGATGQSEQGVGIFGFSLTGPGIRGESNQGNPFEGRGVEDTLVFRVANDGQVRSNVGFTTPAADFAEILPAEDDLKAGDVLVIGRDGKLARSTRPRQTSVAGVYSTKPGFVGGQAINGDQTNTIPLAVVGIVPVKVTAENGPIRPGDLLTTSSRPGHAMRAGARPVMGTVIGKALGGLETGSGVIRMLAILH